jgi:predicted unusual protein kinase regulating ubiquinone biosynthesis (AarF/ABC1/UbiB family)
MEKYLPESRSFNPVQMVEEFANAIDQELDFVLEATRCSVRGKGPVVMCFSEAQGKGAP